jgi:hypothetical protein
MKISKKRTCVGCKAWILTGVESSCGLGYSIETDSKPLGHRNSPLLLVKATPNEPCPKPKTISQYIEASHHYRKR